MTIKYKKLSIVLIVCLLMTFGTKSQRLYPNDIAQDTLHCLDEEQMRKTVVKFRELDMCKIEYKHTLDTLYIKEYQLDSTLYANESLTAYNQSINAKLKQVKKTRNTSIVAAILFLLVSVVAN